MKKILLSLSALLLTTASFAIPARPGIWRTITLTNGTQVRAQLQGDEHLNYYEDAEGNTYTENADGTFYAFNLNEAKERVKTRLNKMRAAAAAKHPNRAIGQYGNYTGKKRCLIILAQFTDVKFADGHDNAYYSRVANEENFTSAEGHRGSVRDYFLAQSNGKFELNFDIAGPYTMPNSASYYGSNTPSSDAKASEMIATACKMANADGVDFSKYDWEGDGNVDMVFVIYAGYGEATSTKRPDVIWPHQFELNYTGKDLYLNNKYVNVYACSNEIDEINDTGKPHVQGIGAICHEFSHCLGYPDLYDTGSAGRFGLGHFDLMCQGSYNGDTFRPAGYSSYEKWMAGWLTPIELSNEDKQINDLKAISDNGEAYIIYNQRNRDEYYLLENRQRTGWDDALPGTGLQISHVDYDRTSWEYNRVNAEDHQRFTIFHADGLAGLNNENNDLYPYKDNNSLTNNSNPAATLYNSNSDGTLMMNRGVTNITQNADGTMSFKYEHISKTLTPEKTEEVVFTETFARCSGEGGNGSTPIFGGSVGYGTFQSDITGWTSTANMYGGYKCAKFGRPSDKEVSVTSPTFVLNGKGKVKVSVAPWASNAQTLTLSTAAGTLGTYTLENSKWNEITADITGSGSTKLTFTTNGRLWINEVSATAMLETGIDNVVNENARPADNRIYTLGGQYVGTQLSSLPKGIYVMGGKKIVK